MAVIYDGVQMRFYLNAILLETSENISFVMPTVLGRQNFIGGTHCGSLGYSSSYVDDIRVYSTYLSQSQINDVMMSDETGFYSSICRKNKFTFLNVFVIHSKNFIFLFMIDFEKA